MTDLTVPSLIDLLPDVVRRNDTTEDHSRFVEEVLQPALDLLVAEAQRWVDQLDLDLADDTTIDAFLADMGNPFDVVYGQDLNRKRLLARLLVDVYKSKGSAPALADVVRALTGIEIVTVIFPATVSAWVLGRDVLQDAPPVTGPDDPTRTDWAILGTSPGYSRYSFQIEVDRALTDDERDVLTEVVKLVKPAHTHFLGFVEPGAGEIVDHWELNRSRIYGSGEPVVGDEAVLHE